MQWVGDVLGQRPRLEAWEGRPFSLGAEQGPRPKDARGCYERVVARERPGPPEPAGPHRRVAEAILACRIFPLHLVAAVLRRPEVEVGDTVGISYHLIPGLDLFFGSRVIERFDGPEDGLWRTGFTYRTLEGHPVCGEETFSVEKDLETGLVVASLRSWSRPGIFLARAAMPLLRFLQRHASRAALDHLEVVSRRGGGVSPVRGPTGEAPRFRELAAR
jgi:hypothetical protein